MPTRPPPSRITALTLALAALGAGCATTASDREAAGGDLVDVVMDAVEDVGSAMASAARQQRQVMSVGPYGVVARYNVSPCPCPPFEIYLEGRWQRVALRWDEGAFDPEDALGRFEQMAALAEESREHPLFVLWVRLVGESVTAANQLEYPIIAVTDVQKVGARSLASALELSSLHGVEVARRLQRERRPEPTPDTGRDPVKTLDEARPPPDADPPPEPEAAPEAETPPTDAPATADQP